MMYTWNVLGHEESKKKPAKMLQNVIMLHKTIQNNTRIRAHRLAKRRKRDATKSRCKLFGNRNIKKETY